MKKSIYAVFYMFAVTLCFATLVTLAKAVNKEKIAINEQVRLQKVILETLDIKLPDKPSNQMIAEIYRERVKERLRDGRPVYVAYDQGGQNTVGYAFKIRGPGTWGPIHTVVAFGNDFSRIIGIRFYRHQETPGLGARINEPWFRQQFVGLRLPDDPGTERFFSITPPGPDKKARELDAVTGATMTSKAVEKFLNRELLDLARLNIGERRE